MAKHTIVGAGPNILFSAANSSNTAWENLSATQLKLTFADGTYAVFNGTGVDTGNMLMTSFKHYTEKGVLIDGATDLKMTAYDVKYAFYVDFAEYGPFQGADVIKSKGAINDMIFAAGGDDKVYSGSGDDQVAGGNGNDIIHGGNGLDFLHGDAPIEFQPDWKGNDKLYGGNGNDVLAGGHGNDLLSGGKGYDLAVFEQNFGDLKIVKVKGGFTVYSEEGTDALRSIEYIQAEDGLFGWNAANNSWQQVKDDMWGV